MVYKGTHFEMALIQVGEIFTEIPIYMDIVDYGVYIYILWLFNIAMENGPFIDCLPINFMVIFHGYVK